MSFCSKLLCTTLLGQSLIFLCHKPQDHLQKDTNHLCGRFQRACLWLVVEHKQSLLICPCSYHTSCPLKKKNLRSSPGIKLLHEGLDSAFQRIHKLRGAKQSADRETTGHQQDRGQDGQVEQLGLQLLQLGSVCQQRLRTQRGRAVREQGPVEEGPRTSPQAAPHTGLPRGTLHHQGPSEEGSGNPGTAPLWG